MATYPKYGRRCAELEEEISELKAGHAQAMASVDERMRVALERQRIELTGSAAWSKLAVWWRRIWA